MKVVRFEYMSGLSPYRSVWEYQNRILSGLCNMRDSGDVVSDQLCGFLIFCEHPHVFTLGRNGKMQHLLADNQTLQQSGAEFVQTDRGGDITYHGPGQLVGYPIFDLRKLGIGIKDYIFLLEESIIHFLAQYNVRAERLDGATGVWIEPETNAARKICAIGVKVSKGITMHGFALNIQTDLSFFNYIHPCGFTDKGVTSLEREIGQSIDVYSTYNNLLSNILKTFNIEITHDDFWQ